MLDYRCMTNDDVAFGLKLSQQANWNQTEADWRRFVAMQPDGCFVGLIDGEPAGTVVTCVFDQVAWVGMLLVDATARGKGLGTAMMQHAIHYLDQQSVLAIRLDATPLGRPIYEKLGFEAQTEIIRYEGRPASRGTAERPTPFDPSQLNGLLSLDAEVTRTDRTKLLTRLTREFGEQTRIIEHRGELIGYVTDRPGAKATQNGPCVGLSQAGPRLLTDAFYRHAGLPVFVDVPAENIPAVGLAESAGLKPQRSFVRMSRGGRIVESVEELWASSGPEKG